MSNLAYEEQISGIIFLVIPHIKVKENAVVNKEGSLKRIDHWVNKMWKIGGDIPASLEEKLRILYEHDRAEQVGM